MAGRPLPVLELNAAERAELEGLARRRKTAQAMAMRARIVLGCAGGRANKDVAGELDLDPATVGKWRRRFLLHGVDGLLDEPRSGAPRTLADARIEAVIVRTLESLPEGATSWSTRGMAKASGVSAASVGRIRRAFGLQPHRRESLELSTDPDFVARVRDIVGLYMAPPIRAVVLCVAEKSQIQPTQQASAPSPQEPMSGDIGGALDRSHHPRQAGDPPAKQRRPEGRRGPLLPMRPGQIERRTHDYKRHGVTSLVAALDVATGRVIGQGYPHHRASEFRRFPTPSKATCRKTSMCTWCSTATPPTKRR